MSRNAVVSSGLQVPLWDDLGRSLASDIQDYQYSGALDAISAYAHEYGRPRLVERLAEALLIDEASPGAAHRAFCSILFDIVCTTNVDFLLERQYDTTPRHCRPLIDEDHLAVNGRSSTTALLKLHGDVHHPTRLVMTEEDYDVFLDKHPLIATYLANLLITRTAVLVGYSLDDPDFRQVWQVVGERLGKARRLAYALAVDARATDIARFARRGIKVINLPGQRTRYAEVLADTFDELREYMQTHLIEASQITEEEPLTEFALPQASLTRLCFIAVPLGLQPQYRDQVFPILERAGLVPVTSADVIAPGDNYSAKIDAMMRRCVAAVVDVSSKNTDIELGMLLGMKREIDTMVVTQVGTVARIDASRAVLFLRSDAPIADQPDLLARIETWATQVASRIRPRLAEEPRRLLAAKEYRAAVISAITHFESTLRAVLAKNEPVPGHAYSLGPFVELAARRGLLEMNEHRRLRDWMRIRNMVVHSREAVTRAQASEIVDGVLTIATRLTQQILP